MPLPNIKKMYEDGWKAIVQPPKLDYSIGDLGLPLFTAGPHTIKRHDFTLTNKRGSAIACSFFENTSSTSPLPCVVYCHANGSCRLEAVQHKHVVLSQNFHFFCFDFTNCGQSTGEYSSVGYFEQEDVERVIEHLTQTGKVTKIALWGRSMGAVASIMYSARSSAVTCVVLDSPFAEFKRLVLELIKSKARIPGFVISTALGMMRKTIMKKAGFDIYELKTIEHIKKINIPAFLGAPKDDTFVSPQHTKDLYLAHKGMKQLSIFEGDHNSQRPIEWTMAAINFIKSHLQEKTREVEETVQPNMPNFKPVEGFGNSPVYETSPQMRYPDLQPLGEGYGARGL